MSICPSESLEALSAGLQAALRQLGSVPREHRTDSLSAATHDLPDSRGGDFTERYRELLDHYRMRGSRNFPGNAHENGDVENANGSRGSISGRACADRVSSPPVRRISRSSTPVSGHAMRLAG